MTRQSTKHSGDRTPPALRRLNRAMSLSTLTDLIQLNFSAGDCLIVLGYRPGQYIPSGKYAETDITDWVRTVRRQLDSNLKYILATEQGRDGKTATVHRIVVRHPIEGASLLAAYWKYGPAKVEEVQAGQLSALAERLVPNTRTEPCKRAWTTSRNLQRT